MAKISIITAFFFISAIFAGSLWHLVGIDPILSALAGALVFLFLQQIGNAFVQSRRNRSLASDLDSFREANTSIKAALDDTRKKMAEVTLALAKKSDAQEKKVVGELQIIESLIREFAANIARKAKDVPVEASVMDDFHPEIAPAHYASAFADPAMLEIIRRSLEENRVDLYLQPTVSLPQRKVRFYEALSRLRSEDGSVIMPEQYIKVAAPAGLMSVVDNLLLFRCVQVVRRLTQKQREIGVFCNISGHTLTDGEFFPQFLDFMHHNRDLAGQIVFEFAQESVTEARASEEANLRYLANLGFRLSMDQVTDLDIDFARLKRLGFQFLKVRADMLNSGMRNAHAAVPAEDFKDLLSRNGINLIAERIEDEKSVVQLLEYNVDFGQGYLFGEPKPIRDMTDTYDPRTQTPSNVTILPPGLARRLAS